MTSSTSAHVLGCEQTRLLCAWVGALSGRCTRRVRAPNARCCAHRDEHLPTLRILRDPRTGEPLEVG